MKQKKITDQCQACNSHNIHKMENYYDIHGLMSCSNCGFVFMERIPTEHELNKYYGDRYKAIKSSSHEFYSTDLNKKSYSLLLDEFEKSRKTNKIIDAGCGFGAFLIEAKKRGWDCYGTEYAQESVDYCHSIGLEKVIVGGLENKIFENNEFDVITSFEVIEHLTDIKTYLSDIKKRLRVGGVIYLTTPNFNSLNRYYERTNWRVIEYPAHLSYFTKSSLNKILTGNGFSLYKFLTTGVSFSGGLQFEKNNNKDKEIVPADKDYKIRKLFSGSLGLILKNIINGVLNIFSAGATLKGYYLKR